MYEFQLKSTFYSHKRVNCSAFTQFHTVFFIQMFIIRIACDVVLWLLHQSAPLLLEGIKAFILFSLEHDDFICTGFLYIDVCTR